MPSRVPEGETRGWIVPIGGAENKENDRRILERFVRVSGGGGGRHRRDPDREPHARDRAALRAAVHATSAPRASRSWTSTRAATARRRGRLERLEEATGIFFTGGNQLRLTTLLGGTPVAKLIRARNARGVHGRRHQRRRQHPVRAHDRLRRRRLVGDRRQRARSRPGLGLTNRFIIDQHFRQRDRLGRLLTALAYNPFAVGIGLDEDTAAFIGPDETVEVEGSGGVTVVDASERQLLLHRQRRARASRSACSACGCTC